MKMEPKHHLSHGGYQNQPKVLTFEINAWRADICLPWQLQTLIQHGSRMHPANGRKRRNKTGTNLRRRGSVALQVRHLLALGGRLVKAGHDEPRVVEHALDVDVRGDLPVTIFLRAKMDWYGERHLTRNRLPFKIRIPGRGRDS